ncbi:MAG: WXG100 family type VII secretion target [Firmicutes bacterium]|nr:WXG100 family type VII secretion target [Bacillota bacterium]
MPQILARPADMQAIAGKLRANAGDLYDLQMQFCQNIRLLERDFSGTAPSALLRELDSLQGQYGRMREALEKYADGLDTAAAGYEGFDADMSKKVQAAFTALGMGTVGASSGVAAMGWSIPNSDALKGNCKAFAQSFVQSNFGKSIPATSSNGYALNGISPSGQAVYDGSNALAGGQIGAVFANAQPGDVVQMNWKLGTYSGQHTAIFAGFDGTGKVQFLEANAPHGTIGTHARSLDDLAAAYSKAGGGVSVYSVSSMK